MSEPERVYQVRLYTVNRVQFGIENTPFQKGQRVEIGAQLNPGAAYEETAVRECYGIKDSRGRDLTPLALLQGIQAKWVKQPSNIGDFVIELVGGLNKRLFELIFEQIRAEHYPSLPSRRRCIWVVENIAGARNWEKTMAPKGPIQTVELLATGRIHRADDTWLHIDDDPNKQIREKAHKYWRGEISGRSKKEIIFVGDIEIVEVHKPLVGKILGA